MVDPVSMSNLATSRVSETSHTAEARRVVTNEDFESVRTQSAGLNDHVDKLKESGALTQDHVDSASLEVQQRIETLVQPGNEVSGYTNLFYDNRSKLDGLKAQLDKVSGPQEKSGVMNYFTDVDHQLSSLEGVLNGIDNNSKFNPMDMIKLQTKMQSISEHVELLSKVVDQVSSGIKTVLQTNL